MRLSQKGGHSGLTRKAKERIESDVGIYYRKKRPTEAGPVFGNIKQNKKLKRFFLRGKEKIKKEFGLIALAHNLGKYTVAIG